MSNAGGVWDEVERNGRALAIVVTNDERGSRSVIELRIGAGALPGAITISASRVDDGTPARVSGELVQAAVDDLKVRLAAGEFDALIK